MPSSPARRKFNEIIIDGIRRSGWSEIYFGSLNAHPIRVGAMRGEKSHALSAYMWSVTHGGAHRAASEFRIQVHVPRFVSEPGYQTLVLGWSENLKVFVGFDVEKHRGSLGRSSSIQVSLPTLEKAAVDGFAVQSGKGNQEIVAAFRPEFFMTYVQDIQAIHGWSGAPSALSVLKSAVNPATPVGDVDVDSLPAYRRTVAYTVTKRVRLANFREIVLRAYDHRCAMCDVQLELIDAAHIVPVSSDSSTDEINNGLALCSLHHRAYDSGLVTVHEDFEIAASTTRIRELQALNHDGGLDDFKGALRSKISVPPSAADRPRPDYLRLGKRLRGWN